MKKARIIGSLLGFVFWLWRWTVRVEMRGLEWLEKCPAAPLALWHGRIQGSMYGIGRHGRFAAMFSASPDGEIAARSLRPFGLRAARGSTRKGGRRALEEMLRMMREGEIDHPALTVDGPLGPFRKTKPGIVSLARTLGKPVLPISFSAKRVWILRSWDRTVLVKPFSRVVAELGPPVEIPPGEVLEKSLARINRALNEQVERLDRELHGHPLWPPIG